MDLSIFTEAFSKATGRATRIGAEAFAEMVSPEHFVAVRTRFGGPAPEPLEAAIAGYREKARAFAARARENASRQQDAAGQLQKRFIALMERR